MKKPKISKRLKKPKRLPKVIPRPFKRAKAPEERVSEALSTVPRITNETVGEHREEVLSSARKYIYPLQHSKHHVVRTSIILLVLVVVGFLGVCSLALYKFQTTSGFVYDVTRVLPFPVAKTGKTWVGYESYLFELRRNMHYYQTQQQADFSTKDGQAQLTRLKQQALAQVIQDAYVKQLASQYGVKVSDQTVNNELALVRSQNRLGSSDREFQTVLSDFWGWDEADFKRELKQQLLQQAVVAKLDTATTARAQAALQQLMGGAQFATVATQASDDLTTKANGGEYPTTITANDPNLAPAITQALFQLQPGQISGIVNSGYTLDILKVIDASGGTIHAGHIQFTFQPITVYTQPLQAKHPPHDYIKV
ncbi:MAG TPA: peptidylprolyl isomerase [Verrucomicrobiae bacterium]|jgi:parvulin-like peptidyl-prolyl isomerase|nr:peptidylprolyl isomerase [Verrucomicrobiae bacterium]